MGKLGCRCGKVISDHTNGLAYKASLLKDSLSDSFWDRLIEDVQSYVCAVEKGHTSDWLLHRGFGENYVDLQLPHGHILHDLIHATYLDLKRDMFECPNCGRILIEGNKNNQFNSYYPDSGFSNCVLAVDKKDV